MNMKDPLFETFCRQRLTQYCRYTKMSLQELIDEADDDERQGLPWKERRLKDKLLNFKIYLIEKEYVNSTVHDYVKKVKSFYRHHYIEIHTINEKAKGKKYNPITFTELPNKEILKKAIDISPNPLIKAFILFLSSTGLSKVDALNLTIEDYLNSVSEYTDNERDIYKTIPLLRERDDVIGTAYAITLTPGMIISHHHQNYSRKPTPGMMRDSMN